jgi:propanol-preferring alcohol dehydrogenase
MRVMALHRSADVRSNPLVEEERPVPEPQAGQVRIRIHVCGVCRTDLHVVEGDLPEATLPIVPGHEAAGVIDRLGPGVRGLQEGDRVGIAWLQQTCGRCRFCTSGRSNLCLTPTFTGYHVDGGYAEYAVLPAEYAYPLPPAFSDEQAAPLLCAGIIGYRALRLSEIKPGQRLGLYGFGASAHIAIQVARHWRCQVYVCSLREEHRRLARELGAIWVGTATEMPPEKLHSAILFAPAGEIVSPALRALDRGGTLAIAGIHLSPIPPIDYDADLFGERTIRSVTANTKADGVDLLNIAASIPIRTHTERFPLGQANLALQQLKEGTIQGAAVLAVHEPS